MSIRLEKLSDNQHNCAICLEEIILMGANICITECSHLFHLNCFLQNREFNRKCPMCRADIVSKEPPIEVIEQQQQQQLDVWPDAMIDENNQNQNDVEPNRYSIINDISREYNLDAFIQYIVNSAANNNISNLDNNVHEVKQFIYQKIRDICINFLNITLNHFRNIDNPLFTINNINFNNINLEFYVNLFNLPQTITNIVDYASNNNIHDNRTFDKMEHDIKILCIQFSNDVMYYLNNIY
jgi:hypothetical protein